MEKESNLFKESAHLEALREKIRLAFEKVIGSHCMTAKEALDRVQGALVFFNLGLELGRDNSDQVEKIISEVLEKLRLHEKDGQNTLGGMKRSIID